MELSSNRNENRNDKSINDYQQVDLSIYPDAWVYRAAIISNPGCILNPVSGKNVVFYSEIQKDLKPGARVTTTRLGDGLDVHDESGNKYVTETVMGECYRLICDKLPLHFTVEVVFALVTLRGPTASQSIRPSGFVHDEFV